MAAATNGTARSSVVTWLALLVAAGLGVSTVYYALDARAARRSGGGAPAAAASPGLPEGPAADGDRAGGAHGAGGDEVRRLRGENAALRRRLFDLEAVASVTARSGLDGGALKTWRDRLEELRKRDPARYKRLMERLEQRRAHVESSLQEQLAVLDQRFEALSAAGDTPAAKREGELVNKIAAVMTELSQLNEKMQGLAELPDAERTAQARALGQQGRELYSQLAALRVEDRQLQLQQLGVQLGLSEDQATRLTSSVERIVTDTESRGLRPRGPRGRGGPGRGGSRP